MRESALLLGYDAREAYLSTVGGWSAERRLIHLLRRDVSLPLSVDSDVWPSVFDTVPGLERPDWTGPVQLFWEDLSALAGVLRAAPCLDLQQIRLIAVELISSSIPEPLLAKWEKRVGKISPPNLAHLPGQRAGYDVADFYLTSALTNCGAARWSEPNEWAPLLNQHHLFNDLHSAVRFTSEANRNVQPHAPFFVFALWILDLSSTAL